MERGVIKIAPCYKLNLVGDTIADDRCNPLMGNELYIEKIKEMQEIRNIKVIV